MTNERPEVPGWDAAVAAGRDAAVRRHHEMFRAAQAAVGDQEEQAACESMGEIGALFAGRGDRYLPRGGVRHRTQENIFQSGQLVAACGISASSDHWFGTGTQDEYERLARIPRCWNCLRVERVSS